jgi:hypothetical protein
VNEKGVNIFDEIGLVLGFTQELERLIMCLFEEVGDGEVHRGR